LLLFEFFVVSRQSSIFNLQSSIFNLFDARCLGLIFSMTLFVDYFVSHLKNQTANCAFNRFALVQCGLNCQEQAEESTAAV